MNVVEILLERNEEKASEQFDYLNDKIEHEAKQNENKLQEISENVRIIAHELQRLRSGPFSKTKKSMLFIRCFQMSVI